MSAIKIQGAFLSFPEISEYIRYWADRENLELRNIRKGDPKIACRTSTVKNEVTIGGIAFDLYLGGDPLTERMAVALCCAASLKDGTAFSMSQAKQTFNEYLWFKSRELWKEIQDKTIGVQYDVTQSEIEPEGDPECREIRSPLHHG